MVADIRNIIPLNVDGSREKKCIRTFSPVVFGSIYSLSLIDTTQHIGFPVDFHLAFDIYQCAKVFTQCQTE